MVKGLYRAASGMEQRLLEQKVISNNLANVNTTGFKKDNVFHNKVIDCELALQMRTNKGTFVADNSFTTTNFDQGKNIPTGNPLDVSIQGSGFFAINTPDGEKYTRNGSFMLNADGKLVTKSGNPVIGEGGEIVANGSNLTISNDGDVFVDGENIDKIKVVDFNKPYQLQKEGDSLFSSKNGDSIASSNYTLNQGYLEGANVNIIRTMTQMIEVQRNYESNSKALTTADETLKKVIAVGKY